MTQAKICGITNLEDALVAAQAGADLLGFIFYKPSPRYVAPNTVQEIVEHIKQQYGPKSATPKFVGVFVNASLDTVEHTLEVCHLDLAQLHGEEPPEFVRHFGKRAYKALRPQSVEEGEELLKKYLSPSSLIPHPSSLIDAYHPTLYGGTGYVTDWTMAARLAAQYPIMLAGSLTPDNVAAAIQAVRPWGVDVSSGVEAAKGRKDHDKVRRFVQSAKNV